MILWRIRFLEGNLQFQFRYFNLGIVIIYLIGNGMKVVEYINLDFREDLGLQVVFKVIGLFILVNE